MSIKSNIVNRYFKKEIEGVKILVKIDPVHLQGHEIVCDEQGQRSSRHLDFDENIWEDLEIDGFREVSGMEFNLHSSGLL